jgi:serine/threonine-protein kinase
MTEWVGRTLSKVEIQKLLGRGGMAEVYLGRHTTLNRPVAVKVLHAHHSEDDQLLDRFRSEAQAVAGLRHPNIVQVFDFDVADGVRPYIVMELLEGPSLKEYLGALRRAGQTPPPEIVVRLITLLASALDYAHAKGIIHRDVKPANVMLQHASGAISPEDPLPIDISPVLTDFGVARLASRSQLTAPGMMVGTPAYMSPEQIRGETIDHRSDIYALGIMLYEMLASQLPFDGDTQASVLLGHLNETPPSIAGLDQEVQQVIDIALAKSPGDRYQSAEALAAALQTAYGITPTSLLLQTPPQLQRSPEHPAARDNEGTTVFDNQAIGQKTVHQRRLNPLWIVAGLGGFAVIVAVMALIAALGALNGRNDGEAALTTEAPVILPVESPSPAQPESSATAIPSATASTRTSSTPSPTATVPTGSGLAFFQDNTLQVVLTGFAPVPDEQSYTVWMGSAGGGWINLGALELDGEEGTLSFESETLSPLLVDYDSILISLEQSSDPLPSSPEQAIYTSLPEPEVIQRVRLYYSYSFQSDQPFSTGLLQEIVFEAEQYNSHLGFAVTDLSNGNLSGGKLHAEHTINIVAGVSSPDYADWNADGRVENPGDDVGLEAYLLLLKDAVEAAASMPAASPEDQLVASDIASTIENLLSIVVDAKRVGQRITAADTLDEARSWGVELDSLRISGEIGDLVEQASRFNLGTVLQLAAAEP